MVRGVQRGRPRASSRSMLEDAALDLFVEQSYAGTTIEQIAQRAGVSRNTFFNYFESKSDVFWVLVDDRLAELPEALAETAAEAPVMDALGDALLAIGSGFRTRDGAVGAHPVRDDRQRPRAAGVGPRPPRAAGGRHRPLRGGAERAPAALAPLARHRLRERRSRGGGRAGLGRGGPHPRRARALPRRGARARPRRLRPVVD